MQRHPIPSNAQDCRDFAHPNAARGVHRADRQLRPIAGSGSGAFHPVSASPLRLNGTGTVFSKRQGRSRSAIRSDQVLRARRQWTKGKVTERLHPIKARTDSRRDRDASKNSRKARPSEGIGSAASHQDSSSRSRRDDTAWLAGVASGRVRPRCAEAEPAPMIPRIGPGSTRPLRVHCPENVPGEGTATGQQCVRVTKAAL